MINQLQIPRDAKEFFDLKNILVERLEQYEKKVYAEREDIADIQSSFNRLWEMVDKYNSVYFRLRLETLAKLLKKNSDKRLYRKVDFDRMFKVLDKIKNEDSVEFLNEAIKNRIEKISAKILKYKEHSKIDNNNLFILFSYKSLHFLVRDYPMKILYDVDASKSFVRIKNHRHIIFPSYTGIDKRQNEFHLEFCNILILKIRTKYRCFRFDEMEIIEDLTYSSLRANLNPVTDPIQNITHYIRMKGKRVYFIDL